MESPKNGKRQSGNKQPSGNRGTSNTNILSQVIDSISRIIHKLVDRINGDKNLDDFLRSRGMAKTKEYNELMQLKFLIKSDLSNILYEVLKEIIITREKRRNSYIDQIKKTQKELFIIRKNSEEYAAKEIKVHQKKIREMMKIKYGLIKSFFMTRKYFANTNLEDKLLELKNYYFENSNYQVLEAIIKEIAGMYLFEEQLFIRSIEKLYNKYSTKHPIVFTTISYETMKEVVPILLS